MKRTNRMSIMKHTLSRFNDRFNSTVKIIFLFPLILDFFAKLNIKIKKNYKMILDLN
jgi:hypothetical protein